MKKNVMFSIWVLALVFYFCADSSKVFSQEPATGAPVPPPKPVTSSSQKTLDVVFGAFKSYRHSSGWFSMSVPENWTISEKSVEGEYIISVTDPTENAAFVGRVWSSPDNMTEDELETVLTMFLNESLSDFLNFKLGIPTQIDGKVGINFKYDSVIEAKTYPMIGESFIEQNGRIIGLTNFILPKDQSVKKRDLINKMINSIKINPRN
ncbi:hypothetical protein BH20ACI4_BH20ACI4_17110 [soil metagenome]